MASSAHAIPVVFAQRGRHSSGVRQGNARIHPPPKRRLGGWHRDEHTASRVSSCAFASSSSEAQIAPTTPGKTSDGGGYLAVEGGATLSGTVQVGGAKNSVLALLAGALTCSEKVVLTNVPDLNDVSSMCDVLRSVGVMIDSSTKGTLIIDASNINSNAPSAESVTKLRASFFVAGPLLARTGRCEIVSPGGCAIGARPVDLHLLGFEALGASVDTDDETGTITLSSSAADGQPCPLKGAGDIKFRFPSVGATHAVMCAAALAVGDTTIHGAAAEPEVADLAAMLNACGADISGAGTDTIKIRGTGGGVDESIHHTAAVPNVSSLRGCRHRSIPDRVEAGTFLVAAAVTNSSITIEPVIVEHLRATMRVLEHAGCSFTSAPLEASGNLLSRVTISPPACSVLNSIDFSTAPYPGVPTDMQPQLCVLATVATGTSTINETVFENRFSHVDELRNMMGNIDDADLKEDETKNQRSIRGSNGSPLTPTNVTGTDLRATAALVLAGLCVEKNGTTNVNGLKHLDRGYERLDDKLKKLGAKIIRHQ